MAAKTTFAYGTFPIFERCLYWGALGLREIRKVEIPLASHVERDAPSDWRAAAGPFRSRTEALEAEKRWLQPRHFAESISAAGTPAATCVAMP